jgi:hypothetical protein
MATQPPRIPTREEQRRLSIRTLVIASVASAAAAVVTSQFWVHGTWIAAAMTPVIVTVVSELLHRPTEAVARRITTDRTVVLPGDERPGPGPIPDQVKVYGGGGRSRRKKFAVGLVAGTAALAFAIGAVALTVPELITGQSIGNGGRGTTIFGGKKKDQNSQGQQTTPTVTETQTQTVPTPTQTETQPKQQTQPQPTTPQTTPVQPAPQGQQQP